jgi:hypothetical protein
MDISLPQLTAEPTHYPDCCLSISARLINVLEDAIIDPPCRHGSTSNTVISIGSGAGLLEGILHASFQDAAATNKSAIANVEGVEVYQTETAAVNHYLPEQCINTVRGTWDVSPRVEDDDVSAILFVYPRLPSLVSKYVDRISQESSKCERVIWLGPCADWVEFEPCFHGGAGQQGTARFQIMKRLRGRDAGLVKYEMMVVVEVQR